MTIIYTDGACKGNPGPGGWGAYIIFKDNVKKELYGYEKFTTNNRMELIAAIKALDYFKISQELILFTDSSYLKLGITSWLNNWKQKEWKNSQKKNIKNKDLWTELDSLNTFHKVEWHWVKAHNGNEGNEIADMLANKAIEIKQSAY